MKYNTPGHKSPFSVNKRQTVFLNAEDPRAQGWKLNKTKARAGSDVEVVYRSELEQPISIDSASSQNKWLAYIYNSNLTYYSQDSLSFQTSYTESTYPNHTYLEGRSDNPIALNSSGELIVCTPRTLFKIDDFKTEIDPWYIFKTNVGHSRPPDTYLNIDKVITDSSDNVYITGIEFPQGVYNAYGIKSNPPGTRFIAKFNFENNINNTTAVFEWKKDLSGSHILGYSDMSLDSAGNIYLLLATTTQKSIIKFNSSGTILTQKNISPTNKQYRFEPQGIQIDSADNLYVYGEYIFWELIFTSSSYRERISYAAIAKYDSSDLSLINYNFFEVTPSPQQPLSWWLNYIGASWRGPTYSVSCGIDSSDNVYLYIDDGIKYNVSPGLAGYNFPNGTVIKLDSSLQADNKRYDVPQSFSGSSSRTLQISNNDEIYISSDYAIKKIDLNLDHVYERIFKYSGKYGGPKFILGDAGGIGSTSEYSIYFYLSYDKLLKIGSDVPNDIYAESGGYIYGYTKEYIVPLSSSTNDGYMPGLNYDNVVQDYGLAGNYVSPNHNLGQFNVEQVGDIELTITGAEYDSVDKTITYTADNSLVPGPYYTIRTTGNKNGWNVVEDYHIVTAATSTTFTIKSQHRNYTNNNLSGDIPSPGVSWGPAETTITYAYGSGTAITYYGNNNFKIGDKVTVTGLTSISGSSLNILNLTISYANSSYFQVSSSVVGATDNSQHGFASVTPKAFISAYSFDAQTSSSFTTSNSNLNMYKKSLAIAKDFNLKVPHVFIP